MKKYFIFTLGCQMNYSDSERLATAFEKLGYKKALKPEEAEVIFFNTCSVKQKAEDRVLGQMQNMRTLKRKNKKLIVGITGCMVRKSSTRNSEIKDKLLKRSKILDLTLKIEDLGQLRKLLEHAHEEMKERRNVKTKESSFALWASEDKRKKNYFRIMPKYTSKYQAFVPIMTGCDNFCTYCVVPYTRGREKSRPMDEILKEIKTLLKNGCKEITLLGQNVNSYGLSALSKKSGNFKHFKKPPFVELLEKINKLPKLKWLRFCSSHPKDMSDELIEACATLPKMCPYIHLPVQSGDNKVLQRMNRNYTREHYLNLIKKIKTKIPNCAISTDIIVGFPGETEKQFQNTGDLFEQVCFDMAYISRYSPRPESISARTMKDDVSKEEKARRWHKMNTLLKKTSFENNKKYENKVVSVLVENEDNGFLTGKTDTFKTVRFKGGKNLAGELVQVKILKAREWMLEGEKIKIQGYKQIKKTQNAKLKSQNYIQKL